ncbi:helix-turn-helix domain-containing protein, partial [Saccharopolyspora sp. K220]|uniref:helix-turn-helix domain-containing protein n=1 Tax=Saccharopolyspora soli TaxID=2926618 RepID=UPI001F57FBD1
MANFKALGWAEASTKTGKAPARQVLDKLCLKCDDDGRVFRDTEDIAKLCEMGYRTMVRWLDYLEDAGLIVVVRRIRPNGSEAKPVVLINYPEAAHLNGAVTMLDYPTPTGTRVMYPRDPITLLERRIQWSSNGEIGGVHKSHAAKVTEWREQQVDQPANLAGWQPANLATSTTSGNDENQQVDQPANLAGWQPANLATSTTSGN